MATNTKLVSSSEINNHMSSDNSQTSKVTPAQIIAEKPTKANPYKTHQKAKALHQSRGYIFTISATLTAMAIGASLLALMMPSCDEGSLNVKLWAFEYQLTKKGNCSIPIPPK